MTIPIISIKENSNNISEIFSECREKVFWVFNAGATED